MAKFTNYGLDQKTQYVLGLTNVSFTFSVRLFVNNFAFNVLTLAPPDWTECTLPGYAPKVLNPGLWFGATTAGFAAYQYPTLTWTFTPFGGPAQTIFGYVVTDQNGNAFWGETSGQNFPVPLSGGVVTLVPSWLDENLFP